MVTLGARAKSLPSPFIQKVSLLFRSDDPGKLRRMCAFLRWKIISDAALDDDEPR
jgi:hypothetical protein